MGCTASNSTNHESTSSPVINTDTIASPTTTFKTTTLKKKVLQASNGAVVVPEEVIGPRSNNNQESTNFSSGLVFRDASQLTTDISSALFNYIKRGETAKFFDLVKANYTNREVDLHNLRGMWESSLLLVAVQYHQEEIANFLLDHSPTDTESLNQANEKGCTIILYVVMEGMVDIVKRLISLNIKLSPPPTTEAVYNQLYDQAMICTPLMMAVINNQKRILGLLLDNRCEVNERFAFPTVKSIKKITGSVKGRQLGVINTTPILLACAYGHNEIIKELIWRICDTHAVDDEQSNILHHLARCREKENVPEIINFLLSHSSLDSELIDGIDSNGDTPLHVACEQKAHVSLLIALLEEGADASKLNQQTGFTPLHIAVRRREVEAIKLLLSYGADPIRKDDKQPSAYELSLKLAPENEIYQLMQQATESWRRMNQVPTTSSLKVKQEIESTTIMQQQQQQEMKIHVDEEIINPEDAVEDFTELDSTVMSFKPRDHSFIDAGQDINAMLDRAMIMMASSKPSRARENEDENDDEEENVENVQTVKLSRDPDPIVFNDDEDDVNNQEMVRRRVPKVKRNAITAFDDSTKSEALVLVDSQKAVEAEAVAIIEPIEEHHQQPTADIELIIKPIKSFVQESSTAPTQPSPASYDEQSMLAQSAAFAAISVTTPVAKLTPKPPSEAEKSGAFAGRRRSIGGSRSSGKETAVRGVESPVVLNAAFSSSGGTTSGVSVKKAVPPAGQRRRDEDQNPKAVRIRPK